MNIRISTISVLAILTFALAMFALGSKPRTARKVTAPPPQDAKPDGASRSFTRAAPNTRVESAQAPLHTSGRTRTEMDAEIAEKINASRANIFGKHAKADVHA